jgi:hypothetical protein
LCQGDFIVEAGKEREVKRRELLELRKERGWVRRDHGKPARFHESLFHLPILSALLDVL